MFNLCDVPFKLEQALFDDVVIVLLSSDFLRNKQSHLMRMCYTDQT